VEGIWDWYWIGLALGLGVSAGVAAGVLGSPREGEGRPFAIGLVAFVCVVSGVIAALAILWAVLATLVGLFVGVLSFRRLSPAAVPAAGLGFAVLAFVPFLGYAEAVLAPFVGMRLRRRANERYAGLRILAKD
jgi:hypothetical protein